VVVLDIDNKAAERFILWQFDADMDALAVESRHVLGAAQWGESRRETSTNFRCSSVAGKVSS
jgi:hypothetical protein